MIWIVEASILLVVAVVLRRVLRMGRDSVAQSASLRRRKSNVRPLYTPIASEIEAHTTILGVLLNDAIEEQNAGRADLASRVINLFDNEWVRLVNLILNLQNLSLKYLPTAESSIAPRTINASSFRSQPMNEFLRRHGVLDQFVFRSKLRFQLHLRLLQRATAVLNEDFDEAKRNADVGTGKVFSWTLAQLDLYFHDLDLLTKETLLGLHTELASLPDAALQEITAELLVLTRNGVSGVAAASAHR